MQMDEQWGTGTASAMTKEAKKYTGGQKYDLCNRGSPRRSLRAKKTSTGCVSWELLKILLKTNRRGCLNHTTSRLLYCMSHSLRHIPSSDASTVVPPLLLPFAPGKKCPGAPGAWYEVWKCSLSRTPDIWCCALNQNRQVRCSCYRSCCTQQYTRSLHEYCGRSAEYNPQFFSCRRLNLNVGGCWCASCV